MVDSHDRRAVMNLVTKPLGECFRKQIGAAFDLLPALRIAAQLLAKLLRHRIRETIYRNFLSTTTIKPQCMQATRIKRLERKRKLLHVLVREIVIVRNTRGARFGIQAVRERLAQRLHTPAWTRSRFENRHIVSKFCKLISSN